MGNSIFAEILKPMVYVIINTRSRPNIQREPGVESLAVYSFQHELQQTLEDTLSCHSQLPRHFFCSLQCDKHRWDTLPEELQRRGRVYMMKVENVLRNEPKIKEQANILLDSKIRKCTYFPLLYTGLSHGSSILPTVSISGCLLGIFLGKGTQP